MTKATVQLSGSCSINYILKNDCHSISADMISIQTSGIYSEFRRWIVHPSQLGSEHLILLCPNVKCGDENIGHANWSRMKYLTVYLVMIYARQIRQGCNYLLIIWRWSGIAFGNGCTFSVVALFMRVLFGGKLQDGKSMWRSKQKAGVKIRLISLQINCKGWAGCVTFNVWCIDKWNAKDHIPELLLS